MSLSGFAECHAGFIVHRHIHRARLCCSRPSRNCPFHRNAGWACFHKLSSWTVCLHFKRGKLNDPSPNQNIFISSDIWKPCNYWTSNWQNWYAQCAICNTTYFFLPHQTGFGMNAIHGNSAKRSSSHHWALAFFKNRPWSFSWREEA